MYFYDMTSIMILLPAIIFAMFAQAQVKSAFNKYSRVANRMNLTGAEAARKMLDYNGLQHVKINRIGGSMTDNYNPKTQTLNLSETVYGVKSVAAVSVACHEAGHAMQHAMGYAPLKIRNSIVPAVNFASMLTWPMIIIGIVLIGAGGYEMTYFGNMLFNIGVIAFSAIILFHAITLPVEFNASSRAIDKMMEYGLVSADDIPGSKKVLRAAALTYVAALATAIANLLRILAIRGRD